jgi:hypothetical protein
LAALQWARANGCDDWDESTIVQRSGGGRAPFSTRVTDGAWDTNIDIEDGCMQYQGTSNTIAVYVDLISWWSASVRHQPWYSCSTTEITNKKRPPAFTHVCHARSLPARLHISSQHDLTKQDGHVFEELIVRQKGYIMMCGPDWRVSTIHKSLITKWAYLSTR